MARRSKNVNGDGSVYKRGDGYEAAITVDGKRRTQRAKTKTEAEAALRRLRALRDTGTLPRQADATTAEFLTFWLTQRKPFLRYSTWRRYSEYVNNHAIPVIGAVPLVRLGAIHLDSLYATCLTKGLAPRSVLHLHRVLHKALADAEAWDRVDRNVAGKAQPPHIRDTSPEVLAPGEVARLLDAARDHPFGPLFILAVTTGVRQGELLGLRWSDLDLDNGGVARVRQTVQREEKGRSVGAPKTEQSRRDVEVIAPAREALLVHRRRQATLRLAAGGEWSDPDLVFTDERGVPLNPARVSRRFRSFMRGLGMDTIPFKNLRHTFATLHLDTGLSDKVVSEAMGHTRTSTTNTYYRRVDRRHQQDAASRLEALLSAAGAADVAGGVAGGSPEADITDEVG
ncbi:MAG: site-specific integrase [Mycobacteriales bacterium]|nr:site-specific integrase [Mycobacteriales bacterium]